MGTDSLNPLHKRKGSVGQWIAFRTPGKILSVFRAKRVFMSRFTNAELNKFRDTSRCSACVHYTGCQLWLALLLMNDELGHPAWTSSSRT
jgi:hypothetical protein